MEKNCVIHSWKSLPKCVTAIKKQERGLRIYIFKIRKLEQVKGGVAECRWGMGRDSGKCLHQLDVL